MGQRWLSETDKQRAHIDQYGIDNLDRLTLALIADAVLADINKHQITLQDLEDDGVDVETISGLSHELRQAHEFHRELMARASPVS